MSDNTDNWDKVFDNEVEGKLGHKEVTTTPTNNNNSWSKDKIDYYESFPSMYDKVELPPEEKPKEDTIGFYSELTVPQDKLDKLTAKQDKLENKSILEYLDYKRAVVRIFTRHTEEPKNLAEFICANYRERDIEHYNTTNKIDIKVPPLKLPIKDKYWGMAKYLFNYNENSKVKGFNALANVRKCMFALGAEFKSPANFVVIYSPTNANLSSEIDLDKTKEFIGIYLRVLEKLNIRVLNLARDDFETEFITFLKTLKG